MRWLAHQAPSIGLSVWGVFVFMLVGNKRRVGWVCGMLGQLFWLSYAIWLSQWGLIIGCVLYGSTYLRNWLKWKPVVVVDERLARIRQRWETEKWGQS